MPSGRITLLLTSPRVAPGLLAFPAWDLLRRADRVLTDDPHHPQRASIEAADVAVETVDATAAGAPEVAVRLVDEAAAGAELVWLAADDGAPDLGRALGHLLARRAEAGVTGLPDLEVVPASYDLPGARLLDLVAVMDQLRARCPWVRQQTHRSLVRYLVEEAYETVEAIESGNRVHLREELGDLLFQVVFHARLAEEPGGQAGGVDTDEAEVDEADVEEPDALEPEAPDASPTWTIDDVAGDLVEKLIRRNPHVFGTGAGDAASADTATDTDTDAATDTATAAEVENVWDALKAQEKQRTSAVEGVPLALPGLTLAEKLLGRTARSGLDLAVPAATDLADLPSHPDAEQLGDALLAMVDRARAAGLDPEQALRDACRRYVAAVHAAEA